MQKARESWRRSNTQGGALWASRTMTEWDYGRAATNSSLNITAMLPTKEGEPGAPVYRHAHGFALGSKGHSFSALLDTTSKYVGFGGDEIEVRICPQGGLSILNAEEGEHQGRCDAMESLREAQEELERQKAFLEQHLDWEALSLFMTAEEREEREAIREKDRKKEASKTSRPSSSRKAGGTAGKMQESTRSKEAKGFQRQVLESVEDSREQRQKKILASSGRRAAPYLKVLRELETLDRSDATVVEEGIRELAEKASEWYMMEAQYPWKSFPKEITVTGRMFALLRSIFFGEEKQCAGPTPETMLPQLWESMTEGHAKAGQRLTKRGFQSAFVGPHKGYLGEMRESATAASSQILLSYLDLAQEAKAILLSIRRPEVLESLIEEGVPMAPTGTAPKVDDMKRERHHPDTGELLLRIVTDHTDAQHPHALNSGLWSWKVPRPLGTQVSAIAATALREERDHPNKVIQVTHRDWEAAFPRVPHALEDVGKTASRHGEILSVNGSFDFGSKTASGAFEILASCPEEALAAVPWDCRVSGDTIPTAPRCADDTLYVVARSGDRQDSTVNSMVKLMQSFSDAGANNAFKAQEAGGFTNYQIMAGNLVDAGRRQVGNPKSRLARLEDKVKAYLEGGDNQRLTFQEVESLAGSLYSVLDRTKGLHSLAMHRLNRMKANAFTEVGGQPSPSHTPSARMSEMEPEEEAQQILRLGIDLTWRLLAADQGKYAVRSWEECLPPACQWALYGEQKEPRRNVTESDSSGTGAAFIDRALGQYFQTWWTRAEREEALLQFEGRQKVEGVTITNLEYFAPAVGLPMTILNHPGLRMVMHRDDNTGVVSGINHGRITNRNDLECSIWLSLLEYVTHVRITSEYVRTKDNVLMDAASRKDLAEEFKGELATYEEEAGIKAEIIEVPAFLRDLSKWTTGTGRGLKSRLHAVLEDFIRWLDWTDETSCRIPSPGKKQGEEMMSSRLRIPCARVRVILTQALEGDRLPTIERDTPDFPAPEEETPSSARQTLCPVGKNLFLDTRVSLERKLREGKVTKEGLAQKAGVSPATPSQEIFNVLMQSQSDTREILWEPSLTFKKTELTSRKEPYMEQPLAYLKEKIRVHEDYAGQGSFSKAAKDCGGGRVVSMAEINPPIRAVNARVFPEALHFEDSTKVRAEYLTEAKVEGIMRGSHCQPFSVGNRNRKGHEDTLGSEFLGLLQEGKKAYGGIGVPFAIDENATGVAEKIKGQAHTAAELLEAANPGYRNVNKGKGVMSSSQLRSPLTGRTAAINHDRWIGVFLNKRCFGRSAELWLERAVGDPGTFAQYLIQEDQTPGRYVMPVEDFVTVKWKDSMIRGIAHKGLIQKPPSGHGEGAFPSAIWAPHQGLGKTLTSTGAKWMLLKFNGRTVCAHALNAEYQEAYGLRELPAEASDPRSELWRYVTACAVPQPDADALVTAVLTLYVTPMPLKDAKEFGFDRPVTPREVFKSLTTQGEESSRPAPSSKRSRPTVARRAAGKGREWTTRQLDISREKAQRDASLKRRQEAGESSKKRKHNEEAAQRAEPREATQLMLQSTGQLLGIARALARPIAGELEMSAKGRETAFERQAERALSAAFALGKEEGHQEGAQEAETSFLQAEKDVRRRENSWTPPQKGYTKERSKRARAIPTVDASMQQKIQRAITKANTGKQKQVQRISSAQQHYLDFFYARNWRPVVDDPTEALYNDRVKEWMAYEWEVQGIKGSSIEQKLSAIDELFAEENKPPPFAPGGATAASKFLTKIKAHDDPVQPRLPAAQQHIELYALTGGSMDDHDHRCTVTAASVMHSFMLRAKEVSSRGKEGFLWEHVTFWGADGKKLTGSGVKEAVRVTILVLSTKNKLGRCTRSLPAVPEGIMCSVRLLTEWYAFRTTQEGGPPSPQSNVFTMQNGSVVKREVIHDAMVKVLVSVGIPKEMAGSHSLRRGGASMYRAAGVPDDDIKRFGRWESDAFKCYIHVETTSMDPFMKKACTIAPRFELN